MSIRNAFVRSAIHDAASARPVRTARPGEPAVSAQSSTDKSAKSKKQLERERKAALRKLQEQALSELIDRSAHFLVLYDGHIIATFSREDDAMLYEGELADLDRAHGVQGAECAVLDRRGRRIGGYMITAGSMYAFVRDEDYPRKYAAKGSHRAA